MELNFWKDNINKVLKSLLDFKIDGISMEASPRESAPFWQHDFVANLQYKNIHFKLMGEIIDIASSASFLSKIKLMKQYANANSISVLIAKYFSAARQEECKKAGICFIDLSGNVYLKYKSILIDRTGYPNKFPEKRKGRNPFADKASLILRAMFQGSKSWGILEMAEEVSLDAGYVSRMFRELQRLDYATRLNNKIQLKNAKEILEDWLHFYDYKKNDIHKYFCVAESSEEIMQRIKKMKIREEMRYALAFHAGAFLLYPHALFNEVHIYLGNEKSKDFFINALRLRPVDQGANILLLSPYYKNSVFYGMEKIEGMNVVSPIQLYLDLYHYPLRGLEQAEKIMEKYLKNKIQL